MLFSTLLELGKLIDENIDGSVYLHMKDGVFEEVEIEGDVMYVDIAIFHSFIIEEATDLNVIFTTSNEYIFNYVTFIYFVYKVYNKFDNISLKLLKVDNEEMKIIFDIPFSSFEEFKHFIDENLLIFNEFPRIVDILEHIA